MIVDLSKVDVSLLTRQRATLRAILQEFSADWSSGQQEHMEGINNLLDHIHDQLVPVGDNDCCDGCTQTPCECDCHNTLEVCK